MLRRPRPCAAHTAEAELRGSKRKEQAICAGWEVSTERRPTIAERRRVGETSKCRPKQGTARLGLLQRLSVRACCHAILPTHPCPTQRRSADLDAQALRGAEIHEEARKQRSPGRAPPRAPPPRANPLPPHVVCAVTGTANRCTETSAGASRDARRPRAAEEPLAAGRRQMCPRRAWQNPGQPNKVLERVGLRERRGAARSRPLQIRPNSFGGGGRCFAQRWQVLALELAEFGGI